MLRYDTNRKTEAPARHMESKAAIVWKDPMLIMKVSTISEGAISFSMMPSGTLIPSGMDLAIT